MSHIFISYSSKNRDAARFIAEQLQKRGATVFVDYESLQVGENFPERLAEEIDRCDAVVFLLSEHSAVSRWVRSEIQYAFSKEKHICPIALDLTPVPKSMFFLAATHSIDFKAWTDDAKSAIAIHRLTRALGIKESAAHKSPPSQRRGGLARRIIFSPHREEAWSEVRTFPIIIKPDWVGKLIPEPFEWCSVPAGSITLTDTGGYLKQATIFEVREYRIARYPITNAQFEVFVMAKDGWCNADWWDYSEASTLYRSYEREAKPAYFKDCANCPRETVSWYSAVAFTRWLSAKADEVIALPTEQQWQRAAQGDDGREYPWGDEWDATKCNTVESKIGRTTPVTQYPQCVTPFGALDMSGNIWEWCSTDFETGRSDWNGANVRVVRGGRGNSILTTPAWLLALTGGRTIVTSISDFVLRALSSALGISHTFVFSLCRVAAQN